MQGDWIKQTMPILAPEPQIYPANLLDCPERDRDGDHMWWVAHTRPRCEKALARKLVSRDVAHYVPQTARPSRSRSGRKRTSFEPLFAGYAFVFGTEADRICVLESGAVASLLAVSDGDRLTADLLQIKRLLESGQPYSKETRLDPGAAVRIVSGPFDGFEGVLLKRRAGDCLLVSIEYLQRGVSIEIGECDVERI